MPPPVDQHDEPTTARHQLLGRLLRALPIASEVQMNTILSVYDPTREQAVARVPPGPPPTPYTAPPQSQAPRSQVPTVKPPTTFLGGTLRAGLYSGDPVHHLTQPSLKSLVSVASLPLLPQLFHPQPLNSILVQF